MNERGLVKLIHGRQAGHTMVEMLVSLVIFAAVAGTAFSLVAEHQPRFNQQQGMAGLNINLGNAVAQLQMDVVNGGAGYYTGANVPSWPTGIVPINNLAGGSCYNAVTNTYSATCFDGLNIVTTDPNTSPANLSACFNTTATTMTLVPPSGATAATLAQNFKSGDSILLVNSDGSQMNVVMLSANGGVSGTNVLLTHYATNSDGTNTNSNDPLGITTHSKDQLGTQFCGTAWALRLSAISYQVDATDLTNPKLTRTRNGATDIVAEQIIGFKVGAATFNAAQDTDTPSYSYDASTYGYDYTLIRSVQISLIGRTKPNTDPAYKFKNSFDQGPYQIHALTFVINPRNLSMNDF